MPPVKKKLPAPPIPSVEWNKKNPPAKKPAAPTFPSQVKALIPKGTQTFTAPYKANDIEMANYLEVIKDLLRKKHGSTWKPQYKKALATVIDNARLAPDAVQYLFKVAKILNPSYKPWDAKSPVKPGTWHGMLPPTDPLSATAKKFMPADDAKKKADELTKKIEEFTTEIARLKAVQQAASKNLEKAKLAKRKLGGIDEKLLKYFSYIDKNCGEFLKTLKTVKKLLYRGQEDATLPVFVGHPRADREPKDTNEEAQKLADKYLTLMGFKALRSNSLFCSASYNQASGYGDVYAIFPKDGFQYTWSTKHDDLVINSKNQLLGKSGWDDDDDYGDSEDIYYEYNNNLEDITQYASGQSWNDSPEDFYRDHLNWDDVKAKKMQTELKKDPAYKELLVHVKNWNQKIDEYTDEPKIHESVTKVLTAYLKIPATFKFTPMSKTDAKKYLKSAEKELDKLKPKPGPVGANKEKTEAAEVIKRYGFLHDKLDAAMKAGHEICVLGEYVAVDYQKYKNELSAYFLDKPLGRGNDYDDDDWGDDD